MDRTGISAWMAGVPVSRRLLAAILFASGLAIGAGWGSDMFSDRAACDLSIYQRAPFVLAAAISAYALADPLSARANRVLIGLCATLFALAALTATYHVGLQQGWWTDVGLCGPDPSSWSAEERLRAVLRADPIRRPCEFALWRFFGLSLAGINLACSLALSVACAVFVLRRRRGTDAH